MNLILNDQIGNFFLKPVNRLTWEPLPASFVPSLKPAIVASWGGLVVLPKDQVQSLTGYSSALWEPSRNGLKNVIFHINPLGDNSEQNLGSRPVGVSW